MRKNHRPMLEKKSIKGKKPFILVKYFTFTSIIVMFTATVVISAMNAHWVRQILQQKSEEYAHLLVENLNHQVFRQFIIPVVLKHGKIKLREKSQYQRMDRVVKTTLHSFHVKTVNIYDMNNIISYSFDSERIGVKNAGGTGYAKALQSKSTTSLVQKGNILELMMGFPKKSRIVTFAPLRAEQPLSTLSGPVLGVVEIVQDVTDDFRRIVKLQMLSIVTCIFVMGCLFVVLRFVVKQGEVIIERRAEERLKLEEKLRKAEHLSTIGGMTAGVSHEIRNPLGIIKSSAELLKKKMARLDPSNRIPDIIVEESARLNNIIKDFLNYAKPSAPDLRACRVEEVVEKNITFLIPQIEELNFKIHKHIAPDLPAIQADGTMLYQAFLNILLNAIQSMPEGGDGDIQITISREEEGIILNFDDQGKGIPQETLDKIWNPFFTTKEMGTGLGLGIVKNIIEAHGGSIEITNRTPYGVRVRIILPIKEI